MKMTYYERVREALGSDNFEEGTLDDLLKFAYYLGLEDGVEEVSNMATARWREQLEKARRSRYWRQALEIVGDAAMGTGGKGFVAHPDYNHHYSATFGDAEWQD